MLWSLSATVEAFSKYIRYIPPNIKNLFKLYLLNHTWHKKYFLNYTRVFKLFRANALTVPKIILSSFPPPQKHIAHEIDDLCSQGLLCGPIRARSRWGLNRGQKTAADDRGSFPGLQQQWRTLLQLLCWLHNKHVEETDLLLRQVHRRGVRVQVRLTTMLTCSNVRCFDSSG